MTPTAPRSPLDQLIIDAEAAIARMESAPRLDGAQRDLIMRASIRLSALQEARDALQAAADDGAVAGVRRPSSAGWEWVDRTTR